MNGWENIGRCRIFFSGTSARRVADTKQRVAVMSAAIVGCASISGSALAAVFTTSATAPTGTNIQISQPDNTQNGGNISGYQDFTNNYAGAGQTFTPLNNFSFTGFTFQGAGNAGGTLTGNWTITVASVAGNYYGGAITVLDTETADGTPIATDVTNGNTSFYNTVTLATPIALNASKLYYWAVSSPSGGGYYGLAGTPPGPNAGTYQQNTKSEEYPGGESANLSDGSNGTTAGTSIFQLEDADHTFFILGNQAVNTSSQWALNGNGAYETPANWSNHVVPQFAGDNATFGSDNGAVTVSPVVTLSTPVTVDSLTFSTPNTPSGGYTIVNGNLGQITSNTLTAISGTHQIQVPLLTKNGASFTVDPGASLTVSKVLDGVGYYHNVTVSGGGSLSVDNLNNAALQLNGGTTLTMIAGSATSTGMYVNISAASTWILNSPVVVEQIYTDNASTINIGANGSLSTEANTDQIDAFVAGSGSLSFGGGPNAATGGPGNPSLTNNNVNFSGGIIVSNGASLQIGSQYFTATDAALGNASATNTVTLNNGSLTAVNSFTGSHAFVIGAGGGTLNTATTVAGSSVVSNMGVGSVSGPGILTVNGGGLVSVGAAVVAANSSGGIRALSLGGLVLNSSNISFGTAALQPNRTVLVTGQLLLSGTTGAWTSGVDLGGNDMIAQNGSLSTVNNQINQGYGGGSWQGSGGISSSAAAASINHLTALGVIQNSVNGSPSGAVLYSPFDGTASTNTDVLVKYTYYGDANLDGKVDGSDYSRIDAGYLAHATGWFNGDFNYDGVINGSDYTLIDNAFNTQGARIASLLAAPNAIATDQVAGSGSSVPEPTSIGLLAIGTVGLLRRRRPGRYQ